LSDERLDPADGTGAAERGAEADRLAHVRHELRTPLNQILGYSELLQERVEEDGPADLAPDLRKIEDAGRRLLILIDKLLAPGGLVDEPPSPADAPRAASPLRLPPLPVSESRGHGHLLVVDDNEMNRDMLARRLVQRGFQVAVAEGGREALDAVAATRFDLILLDVMMPGISGLDVLRTLRESYSVADLPIIMATARDSSEDIVEALQLGANDYVTKPLDFSVVLARIQAQISLKRAQDEVHRLNGQLVEAGERISRLVESSAQAMQDVPAWAETVARDLAAAVGAVEIGAFVVDGDEIAPLVDSELAPPSVEKVREATRRKSRLEGDVVLPVFGMTGDLVGALVVAGKRALWDRDEERLLASFAHQLGGALELLRTRHELEAAKERRLATRQELVSRGVELLLLCPLCGRCYDHQAERCRADGVALESPRLLPYRILGRYRLVQLLAEGGMGSVFRAEDEKLARDVALKIIKPEHFNDPALRVRFEYEARALARIDHPGVISIFDSGELEDGSLFLVMEMLRGLDLAEVIRRYGRGNLQQVAALLRLGGAALTAAHRAGLVHRDIKPENVFLVDRPDGGFRVKILDFGLAKPLAGDVHLTQTGHIVGTPAYMSPEQVSCREVGVRSDLYSFAAIVYEALVGRRVTIKEELAAIFVDVLQNEPPSVSALLSEVPIPVEIDEAFLWALSKEPEQRPADVDQWVASFVDRLESLPSDVAGWPSAAAAPFDPAVAHDSTLVNPPLR